MIDLGAAHLALRARALATVVCTTGSMTLEATATGYARAGGSFITDGFLVGMEITPAGFAANTVDYLTEVTALTLTTRNARAVEAAAGARSITVGVPTLRAHENIKAAPVAGRWYLDEDFVPATHTVFSFPAQGGEAAEDGEYFLKFYGVQNVGPHALRKVVDAVKARFTPSTKLTAGAHFVRVRGGLGQGLLDGPGQGPQTGQIIQLNSWAVLILRIPWRAYSTNIIAA